jgi:hypothetical protein
MNTVSHDVTKDGTQKTAKVTTRWTRTARPRTRRKVSRAIPIPTPLHAVSGVAGNAHKS